MPEVRLIDGNRLAELFESAAERGAGVLATVYRDTAHLARTAQEIEAKPVRHGRWILCEDQHGVDNDNNNYAYFCSQCHYQDVHSKLAKVNFCWNCGSKNEGD